MKYSIKVNEVRAKEGSNIKGFATVVLVIHSRLPISQSLKIRKRESFLYQCQDTVPMSVMRKTA